MGDSPFSEKQQRQSRYDGGVEEDGTTPRRRVPIVQAVPPAHIAREHRRAEHDHRMPRNAYKEVPLTGCQLCIAPSYLLPHSFGQECLLSEEGEPEDSDATQLAGLPWVFDEANGELQHFVTLTGDPAEKANYDQDARRWEQCFGRDTLFLHNHNHDHDCSGTCVKNVKKKRRKSWRTC